ncbi:MATE family efflux transporter [Allohahella marinimesophila]|uniref:MATE family efflux transporter n=1 Tax=Allohahella marinimesophila TaxID=1054972 RepID=A0ABP7NKU7_9GAMM
MSNPPGYGRLVLSAAPIIAANCAVPLLGLADTAIIGHYAGVADLGAVALGSLIFSFVYWAFGFLRMTTTGFVSQCWDDQTADRVLAVVGRAAVIALVIASGILLTQALISWLAFTAFTASDAVEGLAAVYFDIRVWGAPATLLTYVCFGVLIGAGRTSALLWLQLLLNGLNILLDFIFAAHFQMGVAGIALGTIVAEYVTVIVAIIYLATVLGRRPVNMTPDFVWVKKVILAPAALLALMQANGNVMIRTVMLLLAFAWFTNISASFGDEVLAANHVLLQFIAFSAFFLDGFAFVTESFVGRARGQGDLTLAKQVSWRCFRLAAVTGVFLASGLALGGDMAVGLLTDLPAVLRQTNESLHWAVAYIACSSAAFHLDGVFIGATATRGMRNAAIVSTVAFFILALILGGGFGNDGLWAAFVAFVIARAVCLAFLLRRDGLAQLT